MFRFLLVFCIISFWPQLTWRHAVWAAVVAIATFPLKKLWDWWSERFWLAFKTSFMEAFKKSEGGAAFMKAFYEGRAKKDQEVVREHPELAEVLKCKSCNGNGCDKCGNTGWA